MKLKVRVTKADIKKGVPGNMHLCPIARAVRRQGFTRISVENDQLVTRFRQFDLPAKAEQFVINFDDGNLVKPFTFVADEVKE